MLSTRNCWLVLLLAGLTASSADFAFAQGYYQRNVQRNPVTGRMEVVPAPNGYGRVVGPSRNYGDFYGGRFNPYSGTAAQTRVQRNPVTGRLNVQNEYYNPWTGARMETTTRFNPFTRRYETVQMVTPPHRPPAVDQPPAEEPAETQQESTRPTPRVIETTPPTIDPPAPPVEGDF